MKIKEIIQSPLFFFLLKSLLLYVLWYIVYELYLTTHTNIDLFVIDIIIDQASFILKKLGFTLIEMPYDKSYRTIGLDGTHGVWIGNPCNGLTIFAVYVGFIIAFPGTFLSKMIFIPLGILIIHVLNVIRVVALAIISLKAPEALDFNHTYTFTIFVYSFVLLLWYLYASKYHTYFPLSNTPNSNK